MNFLKRSAYPEWVCLIIGVTDILNGLVYALSFGHISIGIWITKLQFFGWANKYYRDPGE